MASKQPPTPEDQTHETLPQSGGSYIRHPDGSLELIKPKAELADLVAGKQAATTQPTQE